MKATVDELYVRFHSGKLSLCGSAGLPVRLNGAAAAWGGAEYERTA